MLDESEDTVESTETVRWIAGCDSWRMDELVNGGVIFGVVGVNKPSDKPGEGGGCVSRTVFLTLPKRKLAACSNSASLEAMALTSSKAPELNLPSVALGLSTGVRGTSGAAMFRLTWYEAEGFAGALGVRGLADAGLFKLKPES